MEFFLVILISVLVSGFGSIVGFGGGVFMIPVLVIVFNYPIKFAIGCVVVSLLPASIISSLFNANNKSIDYRAALILEIPTIIGTVFGAYLTNVLPVKAVEILFSIIVGLIGIRIISKANEIKRKLSKDSFLYKLNSVGPSVIRKTKFGVYKINLLLASFFGMVSGSIAGFLGIGGGFLKVPVMTEVFKMPVFTASSTALFMIFFTSLTGSVSHYFLGHVYLFKALPVVLGFAGGALAGNLINTKITERVLKIMIGAALIFASASIIIYAAVSLK